MAIELIVVCAAVDAICHTVPQVFERTFFSAIAKFRKATISFAVYVRLYLSLSSSVLVEQLGCHWTDFREI
jgi:hypothetical protein